MDDREQASPVRRRTGGRSARVRQAILAAAIEQVAEHGIEGLTFGEVADRAGVAVTTLYRRWETRTALIAEAVTELAAESNPVPDTGTLRGDLRQLAEQIAQLISRPGIAPLLGTTLALSRDPDVAAARRHFWIDRFERMSPIVHRAIERGELTRAADPREVIETLSAPLHFQLLVGGRPLDDAFITRCLDHTIALYGKSE
ncbi:TetR family transcriptional regulator [Nocardia tenerifensis]|uniref:TetR family transcriptional regulator n=1 Tax=Nocardia tenerifensis TaxID=228006 RepID=A0A318K267_9NOCA|nr:TetR/AcrR family transcriptional regulator [Nocardia tenerifensis]PXX54794.1 TetR family transcriptional regulator [Nocardia tenerifensis]